jgi:DHA1 family tetracycline resistance protein-like MFS transporter
MARFKQRSLWPIFLTIFIDLLGLGMVLPVFALLFLDPVQGILPATYSFSNKALILGLLVAAYPFAQFFTAPILGGLSDHYGRKKVLVLSLLGTAVGYAIFAIGVIEHNIPLLFIGRVIDGITGGNICVAYSAIADISTDKDKSKNFGLVGVAFGLGFILGPAIGGHLSNASLVSWFTYATPFVFAGVLAALNTLFIHWFLPETLHTRINTKISLWSGMINLRQAFRLRNLRVILSVVFLLSCGFTVFTQFFQVFLIDRFHFNQVQIGNVFAYLGIWIAISQGLLIRPLAKFLSPRKILVISSFFMALLLPLVLLPDKVSVLLYTLPLLAIFQGLAQPSYTTIISQLADENSQGEMLGINQSIQSVTQVIPPVVAGAAAAVDVQLPIIIGGVAVFVAWLLFVYAFKPVRERKFVEI